jgi:hypothetical protein
MKDTQLATDRTAIVHQALAATAREGSRADAAAALTSIIP